MFVSGVAVDPRNVFDTYLSNVTYQCLEDYVYINGSVTSTCEADSNWTVVTINCLCKYSYILCFFLEIWSCWGIICKSDFHATFLEVSYWFGDTYNEKKQLIHYSKKSSFHPFVFTSVLKLNFNYSKLLLKKFT